MLKVSKNKLLLIAGIVWFAAGFNIALIGFRAYGQVISEFPWQLVLLLAVGSVVVFTLFHTFIFSKMVRKHSVRIANLPGERAAFWKFFDAAGYIMMAIMMSGGIALRMSGIVPDWFIAFFYFGLGVALALSGLSFLVRFARCAPGACPVAPRSLAK